MFRQIIFALIAFCVIAASAKVVTLTPDNFDSIVMDPSKNVFVKFYAPWCGHCVRMAPAWEALSEKVAEDVVIAELDGSQHGPLAQKFGVRGFPTLKYFTKGNKNGVAYQGARDIPAFEAFIAKH